MCNMTNRRVTICNNLLTDRISNETNAPGNTRDAMRLYSVLVFPEPVEGAMANGTISRKLKGEILKSYLIRTILEAIICVENGIWQYEMVSKE